jgi:DegV family protein with EDD domain
VLQTHHDSEGYSALDIPTSAALAYVRDHAAAEQRSAAASRSAQIAGHAARLRIVVDAACDMPGEWLHEHGIVVVPINIAQSTHGTRGTHTLRDTRDDDACAAFAEKLRKSPVTTLSASPMKPVEIRDHVQAWMNPAVDYVLQLTLSAARSTVHLSSLTAMQSLVLIHNKVRRSMPGRGSLNAWVIDTQTGLTGSALLLAHAVTLRDRGLTPSDISPSLKAMREKVHTLAVPGDLRYLGKAMHSQKIGGLPAWKATLGRALNITPILHANGADIQPVLRQRSREQAFEWVLTRAARHVELGLAAPSVCVSYAGPLQSLVNLPGFAQLNAVCRRHAVTLFTSVMSMTGTLTLGPEALTVSFASERFFPA